jgi:predicted small metal-binding protein
MAGHALHMHGMAVIGTNMKDKVNIYLSRYLIRL